MESWRSALKKAALAEASRFDDAKIAESAMQVAAEICVYTNDRLIIEEL